MVSALSAWIYRCFFNVSTIIHQGVIPPPGIFPVKCFFNERDDLTVLHIISAFEEEMNKDTPDICLYEYVRPVESKDAD